MTTQCNFYVSVPPSLHLDATNQRIVVRAGTTVALRCKASGNPPPKITWQKRNDRLPAGDISGKEVAFIYLVFLEGENVSDISLQTIDKWMTKDFFGGVLFSDSGTTFSMSDVNRHHTGAYECEADNGVGPSVKAEIRLQILCESKEIQFIFSIILRIFQFPYL